MASMLRMLILSSFLVALIGVAVSPARCQSTFDIRPVVDSLSIGALKMVDQRSHQAVFLGGKTYFTVSDVDSASLYLGKEPDGTPLYGVNIHFKPSLNDSMRSLSGRLIGRQLAFVLDGRLLATPKVLDTIQTARVGFFATTEAEAREFAKKIINSIEKR